MLDISDEQFQEFINEALTKLPQTYVKNMSNKVAILWESEPTPEQRDKLKLSNNQTLLGLYEGLPLSQRYSGYSKITPDKITIFKIPMLKRCRDIRELKDEIKHTLWHEMAHYFGLNHTRISELEK